MIDTSSRIFSFLHSACLPGADEPWKGLRGTEFSTNWVPLKTGVSCVLWSCVLSQDLAPLYYSL